MRLFLNGGSKDGQFLHFIGNQRIYFPIQEVPTLRDYLVEPQPSTFIVKTVVYQRTPFFIRENEDYVTVYNYVGTDLL